ncbi:M14 family metallopeptidase [Bacillus sp. SJS]|uniref:M14 family metallopeptidase n=1 Tax=Bacillus sp. SJS TaxID=1423321 RepID=UPI0004DCEAA2|nr:M14 family metallopeptidase [Bacillus sp. SJS]KZZ83603.1 peptidase M14 [Bacillus sp. SJS]
MERRWGKFGIAAAAAGIMIAGAMPSAHAEAPYYGKEYSQPKQVLDLYPEPKPEVLTPAFSRSGEAFTSQNELEDFVDGLKKESDFLSVKKIGESQEGRPLLALYFSKDQKISPSAISKKPTVWLQGQIHGNEPAAGEAVLAMAKKLSGEFGNDVLNRINVIIVPRVNPDGSFLFTRQLENGLDGNRDHVKLESQEVQAIHKEFNRFMPEVVIDAHEYSVGQEFSELGLLKYHDLLLLSGKNLNIPEKIRKISDELFIEDTEAALDQKGFSNEPYYTSKVNSSGGIELEEGSTEARIGRNAFGLSPAISFLVETRGIGIGRENFSRRVAAQIATHENIIALTAENAAKVKFGVAKERLNLIKKGLIPHDRDQIVIDSENQSVTGRKLEMVDIEAGKVKEVPVLYKSASNAKATLTRERPTAYILEPGQEKAAAKLENQGLRGITLKKDKLLEVETMTVTDKTAAEKYEGTSLHEINSEVKKQKVNIPKGSIVFLTAQPQSNLLSLTLEPESVDSYASFGYIPSEKGERLPVYRFMEDIRNLK